MSQWFFYNHMVDLLYSEAWVFWDLCLPATFKSSAGAKSISIWMFSAGRTHQEDGSQAERVPHFIYGHHHSGVLPLMLDALWGSCNDGYVWTYGHHHAYCERGAIPSGQKQHSHQSSYLHPHEQTGQTTNLSFIHWIMAYVVLYTVIYTVYTETQ